VSTILDALRRAQKSGSDEAAGLGVPDEQAEQYAQASQREIESTIPQPERPPAYGGPLGGDDDGRDGGDSLTSTQESGGFAKFGSLSNWRAAAVVVGGLAIGLGLAGLFAEQDPPPIELSDKVVQKLAAQAAAKEATSAVSDSEVPKPVVPDSGAERRAKRRAAADDDGQPKSAREPLGRPDPAPSPTPPTPSAGAVVAGAAAQPAEPAPPTLSQPAAARAEPSVSTKTGNAVVPELPTGAAPAAAASPAAAKPAPLPAHPLVPVPAGIAPVEPTQMAAATPAPTLSRPTPPIRKNRPMTAVPSTRPVPKPFDAKSLEQPVDLGQPFAELLDSPPEGAPHVDLLFIRWKPASTARVVSVRTAGQRIVVLHENEVVEGMKVSRIEPGGVEFQWRGLRFMVLAARY